MNFCKALHISIQDTMQSDSAVNSAGYILYVTSTPIDQHHSNSLFTSYKRFHFAALYKMYM